MEVETKQEKIDLKLLTKFISVMRSCVLKQTAYLFIYASGTPQ